MVVGTAVELACEIGILEATIKSGTGTLIRDALDYSFVSVPRKIVTLLKDVLGWKLMFKCRVYVISIHEYLII